MDQEPDGERAELPEPAAGAPGGDGAQAAPDALSGPALTVSAEEIVVDGVPLGAARSALAALGAHGGAAFEHLSAQQAIALLTGLQQLIGAVAAVQARALVQLEEVVAAESRERGEAPRRARKIARAEASAALRRSTSAAGRTISSSRRLVRSMPGMLTALAQGRIVPAACHRVGAVMGPADPAQRQEVDEILTAHLGDLEGCGPEQWGDEAERVLHALDPQGAGERHRTARRERSVTMRRGRHGMATITAHVTGLDGARIRKGLSLAAERARARGDRRGHQQIMADLFADALIGRGDGVDPSALDIGVIITDRALLAPAHADAATVEGFGSVPYEHIREEMLRALEAERDPDAVLALRTLYIDEGDGQLVAVRSRAREFPRGLARMLRYAHQTCRAPHCDAPIRQIDHIVPWAEGGETSFANGNGLCAADNQKEEAGQSARPVLDGNGVRRTVEWTTRYGQRTRRRGIDFDPLATASRRRQREAEARAAAAPELGGTVGEPGALLHRAFARIDPEAFTHLDLHPAAPRSRALERCLRGRRVDFIVPRPRAAPGSAPPGREPS